MVKFQTDFLNQFEPVPTCQVAAVMSDSATLWTVVLEAPLSMDSPARTLEWLAMPFSRGSMNYNSVDK